MFTQGIQYDAPIIEGHLAILMDASSGRTLMEQDAMRPGIEDYLGAGSILSMLNGSKSPEAQVCMGAYENSKAKIQEFWGVNLSEEMTGIRAYVRIGVV